MDCESLNNNMDILSESINDVGVRVTNTLNQTESGNDKAKVGKEKLHSMISSMKKVAQSFMHIGAVVTFLFRKTIMNLLEQLKVSNHCWRIQVK